MVSSTNPVLEMSVYSLRNALELYQEKEERHRFGAIILMDLSVEYILKAKLYQIDKIEFFKKQQNLGFFDCMNDKRIVFLDGEYSNLSTAHSARNFSQHRGSITDSLNSQEYMKWFCKFVKRFSWDNFNVDINDKLEIEIKRTWINLTLESETTSNKPFKLHDQLETYKTVKDWIRHREQTSRTGKLQWNYRYYLIYHLGKYCKYIQMTPDEIVECANKGMFNPDDLFSEFLKSVSFVVPYYASAKSFLAYHKIALHLPYPKYRRNNETREITTDEIHKLCSVVDIEDKSWIFANSYMGLNVNSLTLLTVQDFYPDNWKNQKTIYPVKIRKEVSGKDYTAFIGADAMLELKKFFDERQLKPQDQPWYHVRPTALNHKFRKYARKCKIYEKNNQRLSPKSLTLRVRRILREEMPHELACFVLGIKPYKYKEVDRPLENVVEKAYEQALSKLQNS